MDDLVHGLGGGVAAGHLDEGGIAENAVGELLDLGRVGRGEKEVLPTGGEQFQDAADVVDEAHVEHAVGLVEDEDLDLGKVEGALPGVVEEAARRGHEDVHAATEAVDLRVHAHPAEDHGGGEMEALAVGRDALADLGGEFARGGEDEAARAAGARTTRGEALQHRQGEGRRLAGTGLGAAHQIASREDGGNGLGLDGSGRLVAFGGDRFGEGGDEAEFGEGHSFR